MNIKQAILFTVITYPAGLGMTNAGETTITGTACAIDGDSLIIGGEMIGDRCRGGDVEIRLAGIDAPEWNQTCGEAGKAWPCGKEATDAIRAMIRDKPVTCRPQGRDRYKRTMATCAVAGRDIGRQLVVDGLALAYRKYSDRYVKEETAARTAGRGIWSGAFMTPGEWRKH